jgi:hypothetical protein
MILKGCGGRMTWYELPEASQRTTMGMVGCDDGNSIL